ncbi:MAG: hypothetical protein ACRDPY_46105 [Streptosporangiaceae bacterium]
MAFTGEPRPAEFRAASLSPQRAGLVICQGDAGITAAALFAAGLIIGLTP